MISRSSDTARRPPGRGPRRGGGSAVPTTAWRDASTWGGRCQRSIRVKKPTAPERRRPAADRDKASMAPLSRPTVSYSTAKSRARAPGSRLTADVRGPASPVSGVRCPAGKQLVPRARYESTRGGRTSRRKATSWPRGFRLTREKDGGGREPTVADGTARGAGSAPGPADQACRIPPISTAKAVGVLSNPRSVSRRAHPPRPSRVNSATVVAVDPATCAKSCAISSV